MPNAKRHTHSATRTSRPPRKTIASRYTLELRATIERKDLRLDWIAQQSGLKLPMISSLLTGRMRHAERLAKIAEVVEAAPLPEEVL